MNVSYKILSLQKLQERIAYLGKAKLPDKDKEKWSRVIVSEIMSSEESGDEDDSPIVVRPLPWRASRVDNFLSQLHKQNKKHKSPQARHQMKTRVIGCMSSRPPPVGTDIPEWAFSIRPEE